MKVIPVAAIALSILLFSGLAQSEEVVVTGLRASEGYSGIPAVAIKKSADYLVQEIKLTNDSRSPDLRKKEIISTIEGMLKRAATDKKIALSYGKGFISPIDLTGESLQIIEDGGRSDTSTVRIFVKILLTAEDNTKARIADLRNFISRSQVVGRTEIESLGDVGLSIVNPEKYRYELLEKIAEENKRLLKVMGGNCKVTLTELSNRVTWRRTEVAELTLYIPYETQVTDCTYQP